MAGVGFDIKLIGLEKIIKGLGEKTIKDPLAAGIKKIILFLDREVKPATPVDTGRLRSSITSKTYPDFGTIGTNVSYASFVEYGTKKMEARHIESGKRVYGLGMFGYGLKQLQSKIGDFLKGIGEAIEVKFGS